MNSIFHTVLMLSVTGSLMTILFCILKPLTLRLFNMAWHYYVLLAALLFFIVPCSFNIPFCNKTSVSIPQVNTINEIKHQESFNISSNNNTTTPKLEPDARNYENKYTIGLYEFIQALKNSGNKLDTALAWLWLSGFLIFTFLKSRQYLIFKKKILNSSEKVTDEAVLNVFYDCLKQMNIQSNVDLAINPNVSSPFLTGIFRPLIILPCIKMSRTELELIFMHELTHYLRLDIWYKSLALLVNAVHWFNPFSYLLTNMINNHCESSCDEVISINLEHNDRKLYGEMILNVLGMSIDRKNGIYPALIETKKGLRRRLAMIMEYKRSSKRLITISIFASFILIGIGIIIGSTLSSKNLEASDNKALTKQDEKNINQNKQITEQENMSDLDYQYIKQDENGMIDFSQVPEMNGDYTLKFPGKIDKQLETFIAYKKWKGDVVENRNEIGLDVAEIFLKDIKEGKKCEYRINSYLLGLTKENAYVQEVSLLELLRRIDRYFINTDMEWNTSYESYVYDKDVALQKLTPALSRDENDKRYIEGGYKTMVTIYYIYRNPNGKISKIAMEDLCSEIKNGNNPLT